MMPEAPFGASWSGLSAVVPHSDGALSLSLHFLLIAIVSFAAAGTAALRLPRHPQTVMSAGERASQHRRAVAVWRERRSLTIALIGFSFILGEVAAAIWVPIALTDHGFTDANAAYALSLFWIVLTIGRAVGGTLVDALGRYRTVALSALVASVGIVVFMLGNTVSLPYLGLVIWGAGLALGFPMSVSAMSDDAVMAAERVNMITTVVYLSGVTVGPALGAVGQAFGIYTAFGIPMALLLISVAASKVTKPASTSH
jgi:fucose permease